MSEKLRTHRRGWYLICPEVGVIEMRDTEVESGSFCSIVCLLKWAVERSKKKMRMNGVIRSTKKSLQSEEEALTWRLQQYNLADILL